jgi:uncharacterized glyoxalase superfamily metalloenzyme YdcJ
MAAMYREEVPQYQVLVDIVLGVNAKQLERRHFRASLESLSEERHGAIRLGKPEELHMMRRFFAVMGMEPVGYYDLAPAGVPVHSTAFRPVDWDALEISPFRMFCSLLRLELVEDAALREQAAEVLAGREIFAPDLVTLIEKHERDGQLDELEADTFVELGSDVFRWHSSATVDAATYEALRAQHPLIADVVCFKGPHINHLTPRVLDIDAAQAEMPLRGIDPKEIIEGPPKRETPILLRQTSFKAIAEEIHFPGGGGGEEGAHKARFGEIEERGVALTPKGRALYDRCLAKARASDAPYMQALVDAFAEFPDSWDALREQELAYFRYRRDSGIVQAEPITYEDFLPVSAAGIFQSNLGDEARGSAYGETGAQAEFEAHLGCKVGDPFALYEKAQLDSLKELLLKA